MITHLDRYKVSKQKHLDVIVNRCFEEVVAACAELTEQRSATWISNDILCVYQLTPHGHAQSIEVFDGDELVGGLYGVTLGRVFSVSRCSRGKQTPPRLHCTADLKDALPDLVIDCQMPSRIWSRQYDALQGWSLNVSCRSPELINPRANRS